LGHPDGLAFSPDGSLLAVANHGADEVTVYARGEGRALYGPEPVAVLGGEPSRHRFPHSVAFSRCGRFLAVSNAGGRTVSVYAREDGSAPGAWSLALDFDQSEPLAFEAANAANRMEGGPKGLAFADDLLAVCNPVQGLRVFRLAADGVAALAR
jgi:hypothetical protein